VSRTGAKGLVPFHRLGVILVILGMVQALAPTYLRPVRSTLRLLSRVRLALPHLGDTDLLVRLTSTGLPLALSEGHDQESDQESHDTEDLAETFVCSEPMTARRTFQRLRIAAAPGPVLKSGRGSGRMPFAPQNSRALSLLAASPSLTTRLCRFTC
jgi:hypothetical protein